MSRSLCGGEHVLTISAGFSTISAKTPYDTVAKANMTTSRVVVRLSGLSHLPTSIEGPGSLLTSSMGIGLSFHLSKKNCECSLMTR